VEGNSGDAVRQRDYAVDYSKIMGYGGGGLGKIGYIIGENCLFGFCF
jgi:hypothetical protein